MLTFKEAAIKVQAAYSACAFPHFGKTPIDAITAADVPTALNEGFTTVPLQ